MKELEAYVDYQVRQLESALAEVKHRLEKTRVFRADPLLSASGGVHGAKDYANALQRTVTEDLLPALQVYERLVEIEDIEKKRPK